MIIKRIINRIYRTPKKSFLNRFKIKRLLRKGVVNLEIGLSKKRKGWFTIDACRGGDLQIDLTKDFPFPDNSLDEIHSEHFFEHLTLPEIRKLLKQCYKTLKKKGILSFSVPDTDQVLALIKGKTTKEDLFKYIIEDIPIEDTFTDLDILNWVANRHGIHKFMFNQENLIQRLKEAGFLKIYKRNFNPQKDYDKRLCTIYIEAVK